MKSASGASQFDLSLEVWETGQWHWQMTLKRSNTLPTSYARSYVLWGTVDIS